MVAHEPVDDIYVDIYFPEELPARLPCAAAGVRGQLRAVPLPAGAGRAAPAGRPLSATLQRAGPEAAQAGAEVPYRGEDIPV